MFIGHYAVAFAAKRVEPRVSLGTYVLSAQFLDLLWPVFVLTGVEHVRIAPGITAMTPLDFYDYPYSHSLVMTVVWAGVVGGAFYLLRRNLRAALVVAACVVSHWLLDFASHRPDMPIGVVGPYVGLGLWYSKLGTALVECGSLSLGLALYSTATHARSKIGNRVLIAYVAVLVAIYATQFFAPPPPSDMVVAWMDLGQVVFIAGAYWIDRLRPSMAELERELIARRRAARQ